MVLALVVGLVAGGVNGAYASVVSIEDMVKSPVGVEFYGERSFTLEHVVGDDFLFSYEETANMELFGKVGFHLILATDYILFDKVDLSTDLSMSINRLWNTEWNIVLGGRHHIFTRKNVVYLTLRSSW